MVPYLSKYGHHINHDSQVMYAVGKLIVVEVAMVNEANLGDGTREGRGYVPHSYYYHSIEMLFFSIQIIKVYIRTNF